MPSGSQLAETPHSRLDRALADLSAAKESWARLPLARKIDYARVLRDGVQRVAAGGVDAALEAKGIDPRSPRAGEEWIGGPYVTSRVLRLLIDSLDRLRRRGGLQIPPSRLRVRGDKRLAVEVFPHDVYDRALYAGFRAEVWMQPGVDRSNLGDHVASFYRRPHPAGGVALVLGAGNVASIGPLDVIHKLFVEGRVAILKLNPVNDYLGPFIEDAFGELIHDGYVRVAYGGAEVGSYLVNHPAVDEIHITGGAATHDAIVYGPGPEGARRRAAGEPLLAKRITSELGNVSPVILVPGRWSNAELEFHAESLATQMVQNGGFNCNAVRVILTHRDWPQRDAFLDHLRRVLASLPPRRAYYPGAAERRERFLAAYPDAEEIGPAGEDLDLQPVLATGLDPDSCEPLAFREEAFCAFSAEATLAANGAEDFLRRAVDFANERLYGTLNASVVCRPSTRKRLGPSFDRAVADLRYGTVGVNQWPALGYGIGSTPWGAFPGHTLDDIQSGIGTVHNTFLFDRPEKTVIDAPFTVWPRPPWFVTHRGGARLAERLTRFEAHPGPVELARVLLAAVGG